MDIHLLKKVSRNEAKRLLCEYVGHRLKVIVTEDIDEILKEEDNSNLLWCNLVHRKYGDVQTTMQLYGNLKEIGDFLRLGQWLATNGGYESIADYQDKLGYAEWNQFDIYGNLHLVIEDINFQYPEGEDGIKILGKK